MCFLVRQNGCVNPEGGLGFTKGLSLVKICLSSVWFLLCLPNMHMWHISVPTSASTHLYKQRHMSKNILLLSLSPFFLWYALGIHTLKPRENLVGGWLTGADYVRAVAVNQDQTPPPNLWPHHCPDNLKLSENCAETSTSPRYRPCFFSCVCVCVWGVGGGIEGLHVKDNYTAPDS